MQQASPNNGNGHPPPDSLRDAASHLKDASRALASAADALEASRSSPARPAELALQPEERLTQKQLSAIRAASRRAALTDQALRGLVAQVSQGSDPTRLSKFEASALLDKLDAMNGYRR